RAVQRYPRLAKNARLGAADRPESCGGCPRRLSANERVTVRSVAAGEFVALEGVIMAKGKGSECPNCGKLSFHDNGALSTCRSCQAVGWSWHKAVKKVRAVPPENRPVP